MTFGTVRCPVCREWFAPGGHPPSLGTADELTTHDLGERWHITGERVRQLARREDFPAPVPGRLDGRIRRWRRIDIEQFEPYRIRKGGRPPKNWGT